ncbi:unnamed protein product [Arctia plantaginis]|uniref:Uncharacterized protein n=1 Tax=Arctia plantaginis TaxID=874455 RepID=A0A8S0ZT00_ARCPL|nr:unnamed protein product [Arctia plantaginis]
MQLPSMMKYWKNEAKLLKEDGGVHPTWRKREAEGEFALLYKELIDNESKFHGSKGVSSEGLDSGVGVGVVIGTGAYTGVELVDDADVVLLIGDV